MLAFPSLLPLLSISGPSSASLFRNLIANLQGTAQHVVKLKYCEEKKILVHLPAYGFEKPLLLGVDVSEKYGNSISADPSIVSRTIKW